MSGGPTLYPRTPPDWWAISPVLPFDDYREIRTPPDWWAISPVLPFDDYREIEKFKSEEGDKSPLNLSTL